MTEFAQETRHYCRNPRCRSRLSAPVNNPREAFCTCGCHAQFYRKRCVVCEGPIERKAGNQKVCKKAKCRNAWKAGLGFGCYSASNDAKLTLAAVRTGTQTRPKSSGFPLAAERSVCLSATTRRTACRGQPTAAA
jgi:hypothetical protein